jgi:hypothetical protein
MKKLLVLFAAFAMVATASLAMAADWDFYGSARLGTWYESGKAQPLLNSHFNSAGDLNQTDNELNWYLQGNSRIGAKVKHGTVSGYFEYGTGVNVRKLYATWKPENAGWSLLVGQTYTPINIFISGQAYASDEGMLSTGIPYLGRQPMLQFQWEGLKVALIKVSKANNFGVIFPHADGSFDYATGNGIAGDVDVYLPKLEVGYHFGADMWFMDVAAGFQTYKVEDPLDRFGSQDINSGVVTLAGGVNFGPAYIKAQAMYGQNVGSYGLYGNDSKYWGTPMINPTGQNQSLALWTNSASDSVLKANLDAEGNPSYDIEDTTTWGLAGVVGFKINDMIGLEFGASYMDHDNDFFVDDAKVFAAYLQAPITLAKGVYFIPEGGYYDPDTRLDQVNIVTAPDGSQTFTSVDAESFWYIGAKWQINF